MSGSSSGRKPSSSCAWRNFFCRPRSTKAWIGSSRRRTRPIRRASSLRKWPWPNSLSQVAVLARLTVMELETAESSGRRAAFEAHRGRLWGVAYRMLGSRADADDMVQEAYLRWHGAPTAEVRTPEAWLVTTTTRLCIDRLRQLRTEREAYIGP